MPIIGNRLMRSKSTYGNSGHCSNSAGSLRKSHWKLDLSNPYHCACAKPLLKFKRRHILYIMAYIDLSNKKIISLIPNTQLVLFHFNIDPPVLENPKNINKFLLFLICFCSYRLFEFCIFLWLGAVHKLRDTNFKIFNPNLSPF